MTRARLLKPGFFLNEELAELPYPARILFEGLWCIADRNGRLEDRPKRIKHETLPYDNEDVDTLLDQLHTAGFILRYVVDGAHYIQVVNFAKHQTPHVREAPSMIPAPDEHRTSTVLAPDEHRTSTPVSVSVVVSVAEAEAEAESVSVAEAEELQRQQQHAHAREGDALTDAAPAPEPDTLNEANEPIEAEATTTATAAKRQTLTAFKRQFADAAALAPGERGQALDAIIAAYRPRAPDAELIIEATNCRDYYASRKTKRTVDCRLLANWLARWADQRAERQRQQQQSREDATHGNERRLAATGTANGRGGRNGRRPVDLPDPTRDGRWAHLVKTYPDDE